MMLTVPEPPTPASVILTGFIFSGMNVKSLI